MSIYCSYLDYIFEFTNKKTYDEINTNISKEPINLKKFRKSINLTQDKLAKALNTTQAVIANYERGRNLIGTPFLYDICKKYNISADYILGRIDYIPDWCNK